MTCSARIECQTAGPEQTMSLGAALGDMAAPNDVFGLTGTLGAGKTCLVKGMARGLGVADSRRVISPTFVLLRRYEGCLTLYHFDAYRLDDAEAMEDIGCAELFEAGGVSVVEWADHVDGCLPPEHFRVSIRVTGSSRRDFAIEGVGDGPSDRMEELRHRLAPWSADS